MPENVCTAQRENTRPASAHKDIAFYQVHFWKSWLYESISCAAGQERILLELFRAGM